MASHAKHATIVIIMGPSGAGKTLIGRQLATALGWPFYDADDFHSKENVERMAHGIALTDADRTPWLASLGRLIAEAAQGGRSLVLACSALKQRYREQLRDATPVGEVRFVYLDAPASVLEQRLAHRAGHYMPASLIGSQLATLEPPVSEEHAVTLDATRSPAELVADIRERLGI